MPETYVDTYMGCDIYYYTPPDVSTAAYGSPCITGFFSRIGAVKKRICESQGGTWVDGACELPQLGEFIFAIQSITDWRKIFVAGTPFPSLVRKIKAGESVYIHYAIINAGTEAGKATIAVKDLNTGNVITTWSTPELEPNERFKTTGSGAYVGKMPSKDWRLEFKVMP